jgi:hypothetical protein
MDGGWADGEMDHRAQSDRSVPMGRPPRPFLPPASAKASMLQ